MKINIFFFLDVQNFGDLSDNPSPEELAALLKGNLQNAAAPGNLNFSRIIPFKHTECVTDLDYQSEMIIFESI